MRQTGLCSFGIYVRKREPLSLNNLEAPVILGILKLDGYLELGNN